MKFFFSFVFLISIITKFSYGYQKRDYRCELPLLNTKEPNTVYCMAYMPRYGYDAKTGECVRFIYGGCGGNENNFYNKFICENACVNKFYHPINVIYDD